MSSITVPFLIREVFGGLAESEGILGKENQEVILEFKTRDSFVGVFQSEVKRLAIPLNEIEDLQFKKGIFRSTVTFRLNQMRTAAQLPNQTAGEIRLSIKRQHAHLASEFVAETALEVAELSLRQLMGDREEEVF